MGTRQNLSSDWAKLGFNLWILGFSIFATTPDVQKEQSLQSGGMSGRGSCENGECWQEALVLLLSGTQGGLFPLGIKHGWENPHERQIIELPWNIPYKWSMAWSMAL